ncbi:MAG: SUMF1/EgtB/PvdO family nonheme iron enzyme, partial [Planctomycetes bacterium]|nr:SUMF1/EgtB/PvdO family nonheme iron enzyme [Planctomycetota bacterium]
MIRRRAPLLLLLPLVAACATGRRDAPLRRVVVHNPAGGTVHLHPVVRDVYGEPRTLGSAARIELRLSPGRYALSVDDERPRFALPLPLAELGFEPPPELALTVRPAPPQERGWRYVPPGPALRGDALGIGQEDERPVATPSLPGFWLRRHETTNAEYVQFLNAIGDARVDANWLDLDGAKCRIARGADGAFATDAPDLPVVTVSWQGAVAYCDWLSRTTGARHRLPTEAEW